MALIARMLLYCHQPVIEHFCIDLAGINNQNILNINKVTQDDNRGDEVILGKYFHHEHSYH